MGVPVGACVHESACSAPVDLLMQQAHELLHDDRHRLAPPHPSIRERAHVHILYTRMRVVVQMHVCMRPPWRIGMAACLRVCIFACLHVCMFACLYVCMFVCLHVCIFACLHICMFACLHVCMGVPDAFLIDCGIRVAITNNNILVTTTY